jgi:hypothetical protein
MTDKLQLTMRSQSDLDIMMYEGVECLGIRLKGEDLYHFLTVSTASKACTDLPACICTTGNCLMVDAVALNVLAVVYV